jgi:hypothetical protein
VSSAKEIGDVIRRKEKQPCKGDSLIVDPAESSGQSKQLPWGELAPAPSIGSVCMAGEHYFFPQYQF